MVMGLLGLARNFLSNSPNSTYKLSSNELILIKELNEALDVLKTNGLVTPKRISKFCCNVFVENSFHIQTQFHDIKLDEYDKEVAEFNTIISEYNTYFSENSRIKAASYRDIKKDLKRVIFRIIPRIERCIGNIRVIDNKSSVQKMASVAHQMSNECDFNNVLARKYFDLLVVCIGYLYKINDELEENIITKDILDKLDLLFKDILNSNNRTLLKEYDPSYSEYWYVVPTSLDKVLTQSIQSNNDEEDDELDWDSLDEII